MNSLEMILILIILGIQVYVAVVTWKKIQNYGNLLHNRSDVQLRSYYLTTDEMKHLDAEEIMKNERFLYKVALDSLDTIYKRGTRKQGNDLYFGEKQVDFSDAFYQLKPTDYTHADIRPLLVTEEQKEHFSSMLEDACEFHMSLGAYTEVRVEEPGQAELDENGKWKVIKKCQMEIIKPE